MKDYLELYLSFLKVGAVMFGGGYAMLPHLTRELVDRRGWTSEQELTDYIAIAQCTPGVIAINTATFVGHKRKGVLGGIVATLGVITAPVAVILAVCMLLEHFWETPAVVHAFGGIRIAVAALILTAIVRLAKNNIKDVFGIILAVLAFLAVLLLGASPVWVVLGAAVAGLVAGRVKKS